MRFKVATKLHYDVCSPTTLILNIHALRNSAQTIVDEHFTVEPHVKLEEFVSWSRQNRFVRLDTEKTGQLVISYAATVETSYDLIPASKLRRVPVAQLDGAVIHYLFPSRYCQSDQLYRLAADKFGKIQNTYEKVVAVTDWIYRNVEYLRGSTTASTSAYDTVTQRAGVCRDFAHLGIALCRAMTIPARYFTGYAYQLEPPDFHACFEAYIGDRWILFDATQLVPLNGLVRIASGRDAADASLATIFGRLTCTSMTVSCELDQKKFKPLTRKDLLHKGISLQPE